MSPSEHDYLRVLGVAPDASERELRAAWRRLAFHWHPDRHPEDREAAHRRFLELAEAYSALLERAVRDRPLHPAGGPAADGRPRGPWESAWDWSRVRPPPPEEEAGPVPGAAGPLRLRRRRVWDLASTLALVDRRGRLVDLLMRGVVLTALVGGLLLGLLALRVHDRLPGAPLWVPLVVLLGAAVAATWRRALREDRIERHVPLAEEVLRRRGFNPRGAGGLEDAHPPRGGPFSDA